MWYCRRKIFALLLLFLGIGLVVGAAFSFWCAFVPGIVLIGFAIYLLAQS